MIDLINNLNKQYNKSIMKFKIKEQITARKVKVIKPRKVKPVSKKYETLLAKEVNLLSAGVETTVNNVATQPNSFFDVLFTCHKDILKLFDFENVIGYKATAGLLSLNLIDNTKIEIRPLNFIDIKDKNKKLIRTIPRYEYSIFENKKLLQRIRS